MIDERAIIDPSARIAANVDIGPWAIIGPNVEIGEGCWIGPHTIIKGPTRIGKNNRIFQFASIGEEPQDKKFHGEESSLEIGDDNTIREFCTIHRGTEDGEGVTHIGDDNWLMAYAHIAHDCYVGSHTIFSNNATLAGHVRVEDYVTLSGFSAVHQFCFLGKHSFVGALTGVTKDVLPFILVDGRDPVAAGLNIVGLRRRGFSRETIDMLKRAYKIIFRQGLVVKDAIAELQELVTECSEIKLMIEVLQNSKRGIVR